MIDIYITMSGGVTHLRGIISALKVLKNRVKVGKIYIIVGIDGKCDGDVLGYVENLEGVNVIDKSIGVSTPCDFVRYGDVLTEVLHSSDSNYAVVLHVDCIPIKDNWLDYIYDHIRKNKFGCYAGCDKDGGKIGVQALSAVFAVDIKWFKENNGSVCSCRTSKSLFKKKLHSMCLGYREDTKDGVSFYYEIVTMLMGMALSKKLDCLFKENKFPFNMYFHHVGSISVISYDFDTIVKICGSHERAMVFESKRNSAMRGLQNINFNGIPLLDIIRRITPPFNKDDIVIGLKNIDK